MDAQFLWRRSRRGGTAPGHRRRVRRTRPQPTSLRAAVGATARRCRHRRRPLRRTRPNVRPCRFVGTQFLFSNRPPSNETMRAASGSSIDSTRWCRPPNQVWAASWNAWNTTCWTSASKRRRRRRWWCSSWSATTPNAATYAGWNASCAACPSPVLTCTR